jgi:hypothetical protein
MLWGYQTRSKALATLKNIWLRRDDITTGKCGFQKVRLRLFILWPRTDCIFHNNQKVLEVDTRAVGRLYAIF